jgi:hypothetical protein
MEEYPIIMGYQPFLVLGLKGAHHTATYQSKDIPHWGSALSIAEYIEVEPGYRDIPPSLIFPSESTKT